MAYITTADAKQYIGGISGSGDDALLDVLIDTAEIYVEGVTHRDFKVESDTTRYFDAIDDVEGPTLYLDRDLCSVTTITNGDSVAVASDEYVTQPRNDTPYYAIKLLSSANKYWTYTDDNEDAITIVGRWGYSTTPPEDIKQAVRDIVKTLYRSRDGNADTGQTIIAGGVVITPADVPKMTQLILKRYTRI